MRSDKNLAIVLVQQYQNRLFLPQLTNKFQQPAPFSPKHFHKIKPEKFKKSVSPNVQLKQQQRNGRLKKVGIFQLREAMNNQAYLTVLKKLQKNHKYRQKTLLDRAMNTKRLNQLLKSVKQSQTIIQNDKSHRKDSKKLSGKQKVKTQHRTGRVYSIGLQMKQKQQSPDLNYPWNAVSAPIIQKKSHKSFRQILEVKHQKNKRIDSHKTKSFRSPFMISQFKNQQQIGELIDQQELKALRSPTQSLQRPKVIQRSDRNSNKRRRHKMSIQHMQKSKETGQKVWTEQNYIQGWGTKQDYQVSHYF